MNYIHNISLMIHTASQDNFLKNQGIDSYFENVCINLNRQSHKSFELIYIDTFYEDNKQKFDLIFPQYGINVKHVPLHENHRYWFDKGGTYISAAKNTGILYADGELIVSIDDAEFMPDDLLERYWLHFQTKHYMLGLHKRLKHIVTSEGKVNYPLRGEEYINDHRLLSMTQDIYRHDNGVNAFAGTSFSLRDALILNGFNEMMDGCKSLEDCDFGYRLQKIGRKFAFDKKGFVYILDHQSYSDRKVNAGWDQAQEIQETNIEPPNQVKKPIESIICVENYGVHMFAVQLHQLRANCYELNQQHYDILQRETLRYRNFDPLAENNREKFEMWKNVPKFDLEKEREALRKTNWRF